MPHRDQVCCRGCDFFCSLLVELESTERRECSRLCTFLETILTMVWYPSCVATLSRYTKVRRRRRVSNFFSPLRVVSFAVLRPLPLQSSAPSPRHRSPLASASPSGFSEGSVAISFGCILVPWVTNRFPARPFSRARYGMTRIRRGVRPAYRAPVRRDGARRDWAAVHHYTPLLPWVAVRAGSFRAGAGPSAAGAVCLLVGLFILGCGFKLSLVCLGPGVGMGRLSRRCKVDLRSRRETQSGPRAGVGGLCRTPSRRPLTSRLTTTAGSSSTAGDLPNPHSPPPAAGACPLHDCHLPRAHPMPNSPRSTGAAGLPTT